MEAKKTASGRKGGKVTIIHSTKKGDRGRTSLLSGERVSKSNLRIEACGNVDESNAALGLAKAFTQNEKIRRIIAAIQKDLILVGAEISNNDTGRQMERIEQEHISQLEGWVEELQTECPLPRQFVDPGANPLSAAMDLARSIVRRAERSMVALQEAGELDREEILSYINRLSWLLFTLARYAEKVE